MREREAAEWAAFGAQQAAEKAVKALYQKRHLDAWVHVLTQLTREELEKRRGSPVVRAADASGWRYARREPGGGTSGDVSMLNAECRMLNAEC